MNSKGAVTGTWMLMMYNLFLITMIAFAIFGISSIFYAHYIDVRDSEALILSKQIADCLSPEGLVDIGRFEGSELEVLSVCKISNIDRFYVSVRVYDSLGKSIKNLSQGDDGALWIKELYDKIDRRSDEYIPGYSNLSYSTLANVSNQVIEGRVNMEVLVSHEF